MANMDANLEPERVDDYDDDPLADPMYRNSLVALEEGQLAGLGDLTVGGDGLNELAGLE